MIRILLAAVLASVTTALYAEPKRIRSAAEVLAFKRHNPCPSTGERRGACPGYDVDHIIALCSGGPDTRDNMQWLSKELHKLKTRSDVRECRRQRM